jgi:type I restriction enzyme R subunit
LLEENLKITNGEIKPGGIRASFDKADYVLVYKNRKIAVIEAKSDELDVSEGVGQAKDYAQKLRIPTTYSTNGNKIYEINYSKNEKGEIKINEDGEMIITSEAEVDKFPSPEELWAKTFKDKNEWSSKFDDIDFKNVQRF